MTPSIDFYDHFHDYDLSLVIANDSVQICYVWCSFSAFIAIKEIILKCMCFHVTVTAYHRH